MLKNITLPKDVLPFNTEVPFDIFQERYIKAKRNRSKEDLRFIFDSLLKDFNDWALLLTQKQYHTNITIYTLMRLLKSDDKTPGSLYNKIDLLEKYLEFFSLTYIDIIQEAFLLHMNKKSYIPMYRYSKIKDLYYYIAKEIKMFIFSIFRKYINYQNKQLVLNDTFFSPSSTSYEDVYYDKAYLEKIPIDAYRTFLYALLTQQLYKKTSLTSNQQKGYLCQLIKTLPSNN